MSHTFNCLPNEILKEIFYVMVNIPSILHFSQINKSIHTIFEQEDVWERLYHIHIPMKFKSEREACETWRDYFIRDYKNSVFAHHIGNKMEIIISNHTRGYTKVYSGISVEFSIFNLDIQTRKRLIDELATLTQKHVDKKIIRWNARVTSLFGKDMTVVVYLRK